MASNKVTDPEVSEDSEQEEEEEEELALELAALAGSKPGIESRPVIYNTEAMEEKLKEFAVKVPWIEQMSVTVGSAVDEELVQDDLKRELAFYENTLLAVKEGKKRLDALKVPFKRPTDYYAEMLKSDKHMEKVKSRLIATQKKFEGEDDRKKQRNLKKFAKQIQSERIQEKAKKKREQLDAIKKWQKGRKGGVLDDGDDVPLDLGGSPGAGGKRKRADNDGSEAKKPRVNKKREAKNKKFGFGGAKRYAKSNDKKSSSDVKGFSLGKNRSLHKGVKLNDSKKGGPKRPGKSARQKRR